MDPTAASSIWASGCPGKLFPPIAVGKISQSGRQSITRLPCSLMTAIVELSVTPGSVERTKAWPKSLAIFAWALVALGSVLRLGRWFHWRSLWLDEIYLANSIVSRSWHDLLFKPLEDWQAAPPGFLALVHLAIRVFGTSERSLRLVSMLFGLASLPLALVVARRILSPGAALVATAMFVFLGPAIYYSNELKPYSCDVACSLAITLVALRLVERPTRGRAAAAVAIGAASIFLSYPAVFVLAGTGTWSLWRLRRAGDREGLRRILAVCVAWGVIFVGEFLIFVRPFAQGPAHPHLVDYWVARDAFMPLSPGAALRWIFWCFRSIAADPGAMWLDYPDAALAAMIVGVALAVRRRGNLALLAAPLPFVLLAAALRQYPLGDRLALFLVPQLLLLIAAAIAQLWSNFAGRVAAVALAGMILLPSSARAGGDAGDLSMDLCPMAQRRRDVSEPFFCSLVPLLPIASRLAARRTAGRSRAHPADIYRGTRHSG